ncbi:MAG: T9SS type A sorting domain-containing protein, partial [Bacteroidota bacterium]
HLDVVQISDGDVVAITGQDAEAGAIFVEAGAQLSLLGASFALRLYNAQAGPDLIVNGIFQDNANSGGGNGVYFLNGSTWLLGSSSTMMKTNNSSAARYRDHYEGGMASIPPSANWIIRYQGAGNPSFTSIDAYYPNLIFESYAGHWEPAIGASRFQGIHGTATILGDLNIGGAGTGTVGIINQNTNPQLIRVFGNTTIQAGSTLTTAGNKTGAGFAFSGHLQVDGTLDASSGTGKVAMYGWGSQFISGGGDLLIRDMEVSNGAAVELYRPVEVLGSLQLVQGNIVLNTSNLTVYGGIWGGGLWGYVQTNVFGPDGGYLYQPLTGNTDFPIGNNSFSPAYVSGGSGMLGMRVEDRVVMQVPEEVQIVTEVVNHTWLVDNMSQSDFSVTLEWDSYFELSGFDRSNCDIAELANGVWEEGPGQSAQGSGPFWVSKSVNGRSEGFSVASSGALPLDWLFFTGISHGDAVELQWRVEQLFLHDRFEIERSTDRRIFQKIGEIETPTYQMEAQDYTFWDENPAAGVNYYRLKQVDQDRRFSYSPIIAVQPSTIVRKVQVQSLVSKDCTVTIPDGEEAEAIFQLYDTNGVLLLERATSIPSTFTLPMADLLSGLYVLHSKVGSQQLSHKIVKQ